MNSLESIGFYTLSDSRVANVSMSSPMWRCELILTDLCNFKCPYCRGIDEPHARGLTWDEASFVVKMWASQGLKNIRFSGGEPTMWKGYESFEDGTNVRRDLSDLVSLSKELGIEHIAISTNGSVNTKVYKKLINCGVNDFSISLDACCAETGDRMAGEKKGAWQRVVDNIREISKLTYVTVGVVFTQENVNEFQEIVRFASEDLKVADIRILSSAQWNAGLADVRIDSAFLDKHPILKYRMANFASSRHVRGLKGTDSKQCPLMLDDMAVLDGFHFPCIIYLREQGAPVGKIDTSLSPLKAMQKAREERRQWIARTNTHDDPICKKNCLDVCIDYNNRATELNAGLENIIHPVESRKIIPILAICD